MKNFNKDNSMKKFKCVLGMAALVLAGNAFAELPSLPKVPNGVPVIDIASRDSWDSLSIYISGRTSNDLILKVTRDIAFSNTSAMPASNADANVFNVVNASGKNIYIVGENHTLSGFVLDSDAPSLFRNVNNLYIENLNFKNCFVLAKSVSEDDRGKAAFIADSTKANFYLNDVTFENVGLKGGAHADGGVQPFSDVAFLVASAKDAVISEVFIDGLTIDSISADIVGGLIGRVNNFRMENSLLYNVSVKNMGPEVGIRQTSSLWTGGVVGVISTSSEFKMQRSMIRLNSLEFTASGYKGAAYVGGVVAQSGNNRIEMDTDSISGNISVVNKEPVSSGLTSASADFMVGGVFGYWGSSKTDTKTLDMNYCVSEVNISVNSEQKRHYTTSFDELDTYRSTSIGGFFGSISLQKNIAVMNGSVFSGGIDYKARDDAHVAIGGFAGTYNGGSITLSDDVVKGSSIKYDGAYASIGGLLGFVSEADEVNVKRLVMEKDIQATLSPVKGAAIGGAVGVLSSVPLKIEKASIKGDITTNDDKNYDPELTQSVDLSVGGVVGYAGSSTKTKEVDGKLQYLPNVSVDFKNVDYNGRFSITRAYKGDDKYQYVGGFVGKSQDSEISIEKSSVVGVNDTLMVTEFTGTDQYSPIKEGGFIGGSAKKFSVCPFVVEIKESFVVGAIVSTGMHNFDTSYVSGFVGHYVDAEKVNISDSYYRGALVIGETSPTPVVVSGAVSVSEVAEKVSVNNSYVYDSQAAADSLVYIPDAEPNLTSAYLFSSLNAMENSTVDPSSPAFAYLLNDGEETPHWGYDANENEGLPQLGYIKGSLFKATKKVTLLDFEKDGASPADIEIYTDSDGEWELSASGKRFSENLDAGSYDSKKKKIVFWKEKDGDVVWAGLKKTAEDLADGMVFEKTYADVPKVKFDFEFSDLSSPEGILFWDDSAYSVVDNDSLPWAVFALLDNNGKKSIYKGRFWKVAGTSQQVSSSADVINYVAQEMLSKVTLEFDMASLSSLVKTNPDALKDYIFQTNLGVINVSGSLKVHYSSMGYEDEVSFMPQFVLLPKVEKLSVVDLLNSSDTSTIAFGVSDSKGNVLYDEVLFNETFDLSSVLSNDDMLTITAKGRSKKPEKDTLENKDDPSGSDDPSEPFYPDDPSDVDPYSPIAICADSVQIVEANVLKSGTAALFTFKLDAPAYCDTLLRPKVTVSGPDGKLLNTSLAFARKAYKFEFYPLNPGAYTFNVKASYKKSKTIKEEFSADVELRGRAWYMVSLGSWPKNALKGAKPTIYSWNESNPIGDYWQYEAFPKNAKADEKTGYWVRTESALSFSLDLPLKEAESETISFTVDNEYSGWNLLANPYSWNLYVGSAKGFKSPENADSPFWRWNSVEAKYSLTDTLFANEAFWVNTSKKRTLTISTKPVFPKAEVAAAEKKSPLLKAASKDSWSMVLVASTEDGATDYWNVFGVGSRDIALAEPPAGMEDVVGVAFVNDDNSLLAKRILARASGDDYSWKVLLKASKNEKVNLTLEGLDDVRAMGYNVALVMDGKTYEWSDNTVSVDGSNRSRTAELKVTRASVGAELAKAIRNVNFSTCANGIAVNFGVAAGLSGQDAVVRLLDVNGNVVSVARGKAQAGTNELRLESATRNGVYILQLRVGHETRSVRISL